MSTEPSNAELSAIEAAWDDPLEALFTDAQRAEEAKPSGPSKPRKIKPPTREKLLEEAAEAERRRYQDPANWGRTRGVAIVDKGTGTLLGNFSEYVHLKPGPAERPALKYLREHSPIEVAGVIEMDGFLGAAIEAEIRGQSWEQEQEVIATVQLDELMVEAPAVLLKVRTRFKGIIQARLVQATQFACPSGNILLQLPAGVDIWRAMSTDSKIAVRKEVTL